jgi:spermidine synthase
VLALAQMPLTHSVIEAMQYKQGAGQHPPFAHIVENRYGIVMVSPDGVVYGGGVYDGRFNTDLVRDSNGIVRAYALNLFHHAPRDVFMIVLASGSWAQVVANNPEVRHLTIVEIDPAYLSLVRQQTEVSSLLTNPKVKIIIDDANRWLKRHPKSVTTRLWPMPFIISVQTHRTCCLCNLTRWLPAI